MGHVWWVVYRLELTQCEAQVQTLSQALGQCIAQKRGDTELEIAHCYARLFVQPAYGPPVPGAAGASAGMGVGVDMGKDSRVHAVAPSYDIWSVACLSQCACCIYTYMQCVHPSHPHIDACLYAPPSPL